MSSTRSDSLKAPATEPAWRDAALLLCAHGVRGEAGIARAHAAAIGALGCFAEVEACCLHGQPSLEATLVRKRSGQGYVVPLLMAEGYTNDILAERVTAAGGRLNGPVRLCRPVGSHGGLARLIVEAAERACRDRGWPPSRSALLLVGHGTTRHANAGTSLRRHVEEIAAGRAFAEVGRAFLDQKPSVSDAVRKMAAPHVVAVGHFADAGPHGADDVAALLARHGSRVAYAGPVGCDPGLVGLILDRVRQEDATTLAA